MVSESESRSSREGTREVTEVRERCRRARLRSDRASARKAAGCLCLPHLQFFTDEAPPALFAERRSTPGAYRCIPSRKCVVINGALPNSPIILSRATAMLMLAAAVAWCLVIENTLVLPYFCRVLKYRSDIGISWRFCTAPLAGAYTFINDLPSWLSSSAGRPLVI